MGVEFTAAQWAVMAGHVVLVVLFIIYARAVANALTPPPDEHAPVAPPPKTPAVAGPASSPAPRAEPPKSDPLDSAEIAARSQPTVEVGPSEPVPAIPQPLSHGRGTGLPEVIPAKPGAQPYPRAPGEEGESASREGGFPPAEPRTVPEPPPVVAEPPPSEPEAKPEKRKKSLREGLFKTREGLAGRISSALFKKREIDKETIGELEEIFFTSDIGVRVAERLLEIARTSLDKKEIRDPEAIRQAIRSEMARILRIDAPPLDPQRARPFTIMIVGVNGVGKTTTIGKLAAKLKADGFNCVLAAGDTFRAAAVEQLQVWGQRADCPVVAGKEGADPGAVVFDAMKRAAADGADVVIADTAGRLHTKTPLMDELAKVRRVMGKALEGAPHEVWLVLDATTGQNALQQARQFNTTVKGLTGIVLTKLDGTAKGGVIIGICDELKVPVRFIGIGESIDDLRPFDADAFVDALFAPVGEA